MMDWLALIVAMVASATGGTATCLIDVVVSSVHTINESMAFEAKREILNEQPRHARLNCLAPKHASSKEKILFLYYRHDGRSLASRKQANA